MNSRSNTESLEHPQTHEIQVYARLVKQDIINRIKIYLFRTDISSGIQLTTSYVSSSQPIMLRRQQLFQAWNFWCSCDLCSDRTEKGTFASAIACYKKCPGTYYFLY